MMEIHKHDSNDPVQTKKVPRLLSLDLGQALIFLWMSVNVRVSVPLVTSSLAHSDTSLTSVNLFTYECAS